VPHIKSICDKENWDLEVPKIKKIVESTQKDIRQTLNILQLWKNNAKEEVINNNNILQK